MRSTGTYEVPSRVLHRAPLPRPPVGPIAVLLRHLRHLRHPRCCYVLLPRVSPRPRPELGLREHGVGSEKARRRRRLERRVVGRPGRLPLLGRPVPPLPRVGRRSRAAVGLGRALVPLRLPRRHWEESGVLQGREPRHAQHGKRSRRRRQQRTRILPVLLPRRSAVAALLCPCPPCPRRHRHGRSIRIRIRISIRTRHTYLLTWNRLVGVILIFGEILNNTFQSSYLQLQNRLQGFHPRRGPK